MTAPLPCPFCGGEAREWEKLCHPPQFGCYGCNLFMTLENWNTRTLPWRKWPDEKPDPGEGVLVRIVSPGPWGEEAPPHNSTLFFPAGTDFWEGEYGADTVYRVEDNSHWLPLDAIPGPGDE